MCVILVGTKKQLLSVELDQAWRVNSDGAGFSYVDKNTNRARIVKGLMTFDALINALESTKTRGLISLHFRLATHGATNPKNTHPFSVGYDALAHNGVLPSFGAHGKNGASDSADLARLLSGLSADDRKKILSSLSGMFTLTSARARDGIALFGSRSWINHRGVKCSNAHFISAPVLRACSWDFGDNDDDANPLLLGI